MTNLYPRSTGLPMVVWVWPRYGAAHDVRVRACPWRKQGVSMTHGERIDPATWPWSRCGRSRTWSPAGVGRRPAGLADWIALNQRAILDHWNELIDGTELGRCCESCRRRSIGFSPLLFSFSCARSFASVPPARRLNIRKTADERTPATEPTMPRSGSSSPCSAPSAIASIEYSRLSLLAVGVVVALIAAPIVAALQLRGAAAALRERRIHREEYLLGLRIKGERDPVESS